MKKPKQTLRRRNTPAASDDQTSSAVSTTAPPTWQQALEALRNGYTAPIGALLSPGPDVPRPVSMILAKMLAPSPAYRGTRLLAVRPKKWTTEKVLKRATEKLQANREIKDAMKVYGNKLEAAVSAVAAARKKARKPASRAFLMKCVIPTIEEAEWDALGLYLLESSVRVLRI